MVRRKAVTKKKVVAPDPVQPPKEILDPTTGRCPKCNALLREGEQVCPECGTSIE